MDRKEMQSASTGFWFYSMYSIAYYA